MTELAFNLYKQRDSPGEAAQDPLPPQLYPVAHYYLRGEATGASKIIIGESEHRTILLPIQIVLDLGVVQLNCLAQAEERTFAT